MSCLAKEVKEKRKLQYSAIGLRAILKNWEKFTVLLFWFNIINQFNMMTTQFEKWGEMIFCAKGF